MISYLNAPCRSIFCIHAVNTVHRASLPMICFSDLVFSLQMCFFSDFIYFSVMLALKNDSSGRTTASENDTRSLRLLKQTTSKRYDSNSGDPKLWSPDVNMLLCTSRWLEVGRHKKIPRRYINNSPYTFLIDWMLFSLCFSR